MLKQLGPRKNSAKYRISPTLLDTFFGWVNSDDIWKKYWGHSKEPTISKPEFHEKKFAELIDRINRVESSSEAADRGKVFNELVDAFIEGRDLGNEFEQYIVEENPTGLLGIRYNDQNFIFPRELVDDIVNRLDGAVCQERIESIITTKYGDVLLTGYSDHIQMSKVIDLKTTAQYELGQFRDHFQHRFYPYGLHRMGIKLTDFEYLVVAWYVSKKNGAVTRWQVFIEPYIYEDVRDTFAIRTACEQFIEFIEQNRALITNGRVFNIIES